MVSKLEKKRLDRGLSQRRLEELSGVHQQTISRIEKGMPLTKLTTANKLAKALDCLVSEIIDVDSGYDKLAAANMKNFNVYLEATRTLADLTPRAAAKLFDMTDDEYMSFEAPDAEMTKDELLTMSYLILSDFINKKLSSLLKLPTPSSDLSEKESLALEELRALSPEEQDRFIHLIKATPLLK